MKRKAATLLAFLLTASMLTACGNSAQQTTTDDSGAKSEAAAEPAQSTSTGVQTISESLSKDKVICYEVSEMDKATTPSKIYFFDGGKLTVIPGSEFGSTLGDFANMTDDDIWAKYEDVKVSYDENYKSRIEESRQLYLDLIESDKKMLEKEENPAEHRIESDGIMGDEGGMITYDQLFVAEEKYNKFVCKGPFYDLPVTFAVISNASGNYTETEKIVYPTLDYEISEKAPSTTYDTIDIVATVEGGDVQIYDTTYNCIPLDNGKTLCTRAAITIDGVDGENLLVDPTNDDLNALYSDIVNARYDDLN